MEKQYHEIITNAQTGEVTEVIRPWTAEELAAQEVSKVVAKPNVEELQAQLEDIQKQLASLKDTP